MVEWAVAICNLTARCRLNLHIFPLRIYQGFLNFVLQFRLIILDNNLSVYCVCMYVCIPGPENGKPIQVCSVQSDRLWRCSGYHMTDSSKHQTPQPCLQPPNWSPEIQHEWRWETTSLWHRETSRVKDSTVKCLPTTSTYLYATLRFWCCWTLEPISCEQRR